MTVLMIRQRLVAVLAWNFVFSRRRLRLRLFRSGLGNRLIFFEGQIELIGTNATSMTALACQLVLQLRAQTSRSYH